MNVLAQGMQLLNMKDITLSYEGMSGVKDPGTALMETKPIQVYTNENRL